VELLIQWMREILFQFSGHFSKLNLQAGAALKNLV